MTRSLISSCLLSSPPILLSLRRRSSSSSSSFPFSRHVPANHSSRHAAPHLQQLLRQLRMGSTRLRPSACVCANCCRNQGGCSRHQHLAPPSLGPPRPRPRQCSRRPTQWWSRRWRPSSWLIRHPVTVAPVAAAPPSGPPGSSVPLSAHQRYIDLTGGASPLPRTPVAPPRGSSSDTPTPNP